MPLPLLSGDAPLRCNGGELLQSFRRICIQQLFPPLGVNDLYLLRVSLEYNTAALALFREKEYPTEEEIKEYLAGNLCRCSGYEGQLRGIQNFLAWKKAKQEGAE